MDSILTLQTLSIEDNSKDVCDNCGSSIFIKEKNKIICDECSAVHTIDKVNDKMYEKEHNPKNDLYHNTNSQLQVSGRMNYVLRNLYTHRNIPHKEKMNKRIYEWLKSKCRNHVTDDILLNTIKIFRLINRYHKTNRGKLKDGVIARCFYFASKERYIVWSKKELSEIFSINTRYISEGKKIIDTACRDCYELRKHINMEPITIYDIICDMSRKFPSLTEEDMIRLKGYANRIKDHEQVIKNTPRAVASGVLSLYANVYNKKSITQSLIIKKMAISSSSINQYSKKFEWLIYRPLK